MEKILILIFCHLIGDYPLQKEYLALTKGSNWYHLFVHCMLYILPFYVVFGLTPSLIAIFVFHFVIDALKARYELFNYFWDQCAHYVCLLIYLLE